MDYNVWQLLDRIKTGRASSLKVDMGSFESVITITQMDVEDTINLIKSINRGVEQFPPLSYTSDQQNWS